MPDNLSIHCRYLVKDQGWKHEVTDAGTDYEAAGRQASRYAKALDDVYADGHFWTVDLKGENGGSYFQLFHGRLR
jgi:hypothetical protein